MITGRIIIKDVVAALKTIKVDGWQTQTGNHITDLANFIIVSDLTTMIEKRMALRKIDQVWNGGCPSITNQHVQEYIDEMKEDGSFDQYRTRLSQDA